MGSTDGIPLVSKWVLTHNVYLVIQYCNHFHLYCVYIPHKLYRRSKLVVSLDG